MVVQAKRLKSFQWTFFGCVAVIIFSDAENVTVAAYQAVRSCQHVEECRLIGW